ncbi:DUF2490 domain-containing protein [bacterium]|nr:DUF2490 domain-containing protein [bacterium]
MMNLVWLLTLFPFSNAFAEMTSDRQLWVQAQVRGKISEQYRYYFEVFPQLSKSASALNLIEFHAAGALQLDKPKSFWFGYAWIPIFQDGRRNEHRIWQQFLYESETPPLKWHNRARLEERFFPQTDVGIRLRYMLRLLYGLDDTKVWSIAVSNEVMLNVNQVPSGPRSGFDQNRFFFGMRYRMGNIAIEPGYLNNFVEGDPSGDRMNHVANVAIEINL